MAITFARVDDRVIHGQTIMRWGAEKPCSAIIVISDSVAEDELRKKVLRAAAGHLKLGIYDVQQGVSACEKARESKRENKKLEEPLPRVKAKRWWQFWRR